MIALLTGNRYPLSQELNWILCPLQRKLVVGCSNFSPAGWNFAFLGESLQVCHEEQELRGARQGTAELHLPERWGSNYEMKTLFSPGVLFFHVNQVQIQRKRYLRCHFLDRLFIATGLFPLVLLVDLSSSWQTEAYTVCNDVIVMVFYNFLF